MRSALHALIRAPILAIGLVFGMLVLFPVVTVALSHEEATVMDRAAPAQIGMEYSYIATVDQIKETAIGEPVARAGPNETYSMSIRDMEPTFATTYDPACTSGTDPTTANNEKLRKHDATSGIDSEFATTDGPAKDLPRAANARSGTYSVTFVC